MSDVTEAAVGQIEDMWKEIQTLRSTVQFYKDRETHYAQLLKVTDGGQYRADWDSAIDRLVEERDKARAQVQDLLRFIVGIQWVRRSEKDRAFCPACTAPFGSHADSCFLRKLLWEHGLVKERDSDG